MLTGRAGRKASAGEISPFRSPTTARKRISHSYVPLDQQLELLEEQIEDETSRFEEELANVLVLMDQSLEDGLFLLTEDKGSGTNGCPSKDVKDSAAEDLLVYGLKQLSNGQTNEALQTFLDLKMLADEETSDLGDALWAHFQEIFQRANGGNETAMNESKQQAFLTLCAIGPLDRALAIFEEVRQRETSKMMEDVEDGCEELPWMAQLEEAAELSVEMLTEDWPILSGQNSFIKAAGKDGGLKGQRKSSIIIRQSSSKVNLRQASSASLVSAISGLHNLEAELPDIPWEGPLSPFAPGAMAKLISQVYLKCLAKKAAQALTGVLQNLKDCDETNESHAWMDIKCVCEWIRSVPAQILKATLLYPGCDSHCWAMLPGIAGQSSFPTALSKAWGDLLIAETQMWASMNFGALFKEKTEDILKSLLNASQKDKNVAVDNLDSANMEKLLSSFHAILKALMHSKAWVLAISLGHFEEKEQEEDKGGFGSAEQCIMKTFQVMGKAVDHLCQTVLTEPWMGQPMWVLGRLVAFIGQVRHALAKIGAELALVQISMNVQLEQANLISLSDQLDRTAISLVRLATEKALHVCETYLLPEVETNAWHHHQPFMRNSRCSYGVRGWGLHLRTLCLDLSPCLRKPETQWCFRDAVGNTLQETLLRLVARYLCIIPARARMKQYRIDLSYIAVTSLIIASALEYNDYNDHASDDEEEGNIFQAQLSNKQNADAISLTMPESTLNCLKGIYSSVHVILTVMVLMTGSAQDVIDFLAKAVEDDVEFCKTSQMNASVKDCILGLDLNAQLHSMLGYLNSMEEFNPAYENQKVGKKASKKKVPVKDPGSLTHDDLVNLQVNVQSILNPCILATEQVSVIVERRLELQHWEAFPALTDEQNEAAKLLTQHLDAFNKRKCSPELLDQRSQSS